MIYDFDTVIDRRGTASLKWNKYGEDVLPLWVADMDFPSAEPVLQALHHRIDHGIFGYTRPTQELRDVIRHRLIEWADAGDVDVILTTGGTGLGPRDVTPEATLPILDKIVPGIPEAMRIQTFGKTPTAVLSRAVAGIRKKSLIINMPGSPSGVRECLEVIIDPIIHAVEIISGTVSEHSTETQHAH